MATCPILKDLENRFVDTRHGDISALLLEAAADVLSGRCAHLDCPHRRVQLLRQHVMPFLALIGSLTALVSLFYRLW